MNVDLIAVTQPCSRLKDLGINTAEDLIVYVARASNPKNQLNVATGPKLLNYCIQHSHWSPFEQVDMTVEIVTSRAISAQILRHRSFSFQEFSQRYSEVTEMEPVEMRYQADSNRQSSTTACEDSYIDYAFKSVLDMAKLRYNELLNKGVAKECARMLLPMCSKTTIYMKGSIRSWIHYLQLRTKQDTQKEHRLIAESILTIFVDTFPVIAEALNLNK